MTEFSSTSATEVTSSPTAGAVAPPGGEVVDPGSEDADQNDVAMALLYQYILESLILELGEHDTTKGLWDAIKARNIGVERVREARLQTIMSDLCDKTGHIESLCPKRIQKLQEVNMLETEEADLILVIHKLVYLNKDNMISKRIETEEGGDHEEIWYFGEVKIGDGSIVAIGGKGFIAFERKSGVKKVIDGVYYIPHLRTNIFSLGQATEGGCTLKMEADMLRLHDASGRLVFKVNRSPNRLYQLRLKTVQRQNAENPLANGASPKVSVAVKFGTATTIYFVQGNEHGSLANTGEIGHQLC